MATNFNDLSTTAPVPTKDEVDNKIDKLTGFYPVGNLLKIANDGGVEDSGKSLEDISQMTTLTPVYTGSWAFSDGLTHTIEPIRRENAFGGWEYSYYAQGTSSVLYDPQTWFNTEEERDDAAQLDWRILVEGQETGTLTATRTMGYQLGDQEDMPLQPAGRYIKFPDYNDMTKHKFLYAYRDGDTDVYSDESVKYFNKGGDHTWTPGRKCIVYTRIHNDTGGTRHIYIYVNQKDNDHIILDTWLNNGIGETFPIMLNSTDNLILSFAGDASVNKYAVNLSVYFVD